MLLLVGHVAASLSTPDCSLLSEDPRCHHHHHSGCLALFLQISERILVRIKTPTWHLWTHNLRCQARTFTGESFTLLPVPGTLPTYGRHHRLTPTQTGCSSSHVDSRTSAVNITLLSHPISVYSYIMLRDLMSAPCKSVLDSCVERNRLIIS
ncbi:hypothetical protein BDR06DRAFT_248723 [Suillus hirtellus]|nr:hypothetical protein BDR06DRAFT_248723 [Suillus hirtellus]